jgi:DNA/RNA endonuclease YhcR with UshA esterase domain
MRRVSRIALTGCAVIALAMPVFAHHSVSAEFDVNRPITFEGTVKQVDWLNPHIYTEVEVAQADGTMRVYRVEGSAPNSLFRRGWRADTLKPGQKVTVTGLAAKNPESSNVGQATITTEAGVNVFSGQAN